MHEVGQPMVLYDGDDDEHLRSLPRLLLPLVVAVFYWRQ